MANAHLAYPDLALAKISGTDPDQDAEAFNRLIECKNNFALGTEHDEADDAFIYSERKLYFPHYYDDRQPNGLAALFKTQRLGVMSDFQMEETKSDTEWKLNILYEQVDERFEGSFTE